MVVSDSTTDNGSNQTVLTNCNETVQTSSNEKDPTNNLTNKQKNQDTNRNTRQIYERNLYEIQRNNMTTNKATNKTKSDMTTNQTNSRQNTHDETQPDKTMSENNHDPSIRSHPCSDSCSFPDRPVICRGTTPNGFLNQFNSCNPLICPCQILCSRGRFIVDERNKQGFMMAPRVNRTIERREYALKNFRKERVGKNNNNRPNNNKGNDQINHDTISDKIPVIVTVIKDKLRKGLKPRRKTVIRIRADELTAKASNCPNIGCTNARSLSPKWNNFVECIKNYDLAFTVVTEVWEKQEDVELAIRTEELREIEGFEINTCGPRTMKNPKTKKPKRGGGVAIITDSTNYKTQVLKYKIPQDLEVIWELIQPTYELGPDDIKNYVVCGFYSPPDLKLNVKLQNHLVSQIARKLGLNVPGSYVVTKMT